MYGFDEYRACVVRRHVVDGQDDAGRVVGRRGWPDAFHRALRVGGSRGVELLGQRQTLLTDVLDS